MPYIFTEVLKKDIELAKQSILSDFRKEYKGALKNDELFGTANSSDAQTIIDRYMEMDSDLFTAEDLENEIR